MDILVSLTILLLTLPILVISSLILLFINKEFPWFIQERPGLNEKIFKVYKLKTMNNKKNEKGELLPDQDRLTPIGKFLRKTSLDELPQLLNVLKGDMSLIGPRPLLPHYLPLYNGFQSKRHLVKPGITGWAQVNGRNNISWDKRFEYDVYYVENISPLLDLKILLLTLQKVFLRKDISSPTTATMERFRGNSK